MRTLTSIGIAMAVLFGCEGPGPVCEENADCLDGRVCGFWPTGVVDGAPLPLNCVSLSSSAPAPCGAPEDCATGVCLLGGVCGTPCVVDESCPSDERCRATYARTTLEALHPLRACAPEIAVAEGVDAVVQRRAVELSEGWTDLVLDGLTGGTASYAIVPLDRQYSPPRTPDTIVLSSGEISRLEMLPDGTSLLEPTPGRALVILPRAPVPSFMIPFGNSAAYTVDGYFIELSGYASYVGDERLPTDADIVRTHRTTQGSVLDLDVFMIGELVTSRFSFRFEEGGGLEEVDAILAQAGIRLGDIRIHPVIGQVAEPFASLDVGAFGQASARRGDLFELSAGLGRPSIPVFALSTELFRDFESIGGSAGGIPGPQGVHGSEGSGVVLSLHALGPGFERILTHELGHFLGLPHTTNRRGTFFDAHLDTPECPTERDTNGDGEVSATECALDGADNLMFWGGGESTLTESQARVLRSSPILR